MKSVAPVWLLLLVSLSGCARPDRYNSNCEWPGETSVSLDMSNPAQQRHLSEDAQLAEDLAIRYADSHKGIHSGHFEGEAEYARTREQCMTALFDTIGNTYGVTEGQVRDSLTHRRVDLDLLVILSFAVFYCLAASNIARRVWQRFPPEEGWIAGTVATFITSGVVSAVGVGLGEVWSGIVETIRVGNGHLSYRADRIPWTHHRLGLFISGVVLFWIIAAFQYRRHRAQLLLSLSTPTSNS
ncbi:MAG: hypothetical protein ABR973_09285 [Candidatus Acidiferrales bacterium]